MRKGSHGGVLRDRLDPRVEDLLPRPARPSCAIGGVSSCWLYKWLDRPANSAEVDGEA